MTTHNAPGQHHRKGISLMKVMRMFDTEEKAEAWFVEQRWPDGPICPFCTSVNVQARPNRKPQPYRCRTCRKDFSFKTKTVLHSSNIPLSKWAIAFYLYQTSLKGVSSMKLHRDLEIGQKAAWHMGHRIRETLTANNGRFGGPVEADETYIGGKRKNMHKDKRDQLKGRGPVGKTAVAGIKDRATNKVKAKVVAETDAPTLQGFVHENTRFDAHVFTDEASAYKGLGRKHESVKHSVGEYAKPTMVRVSPAKYVKAMAHTNGIESLWSMLKRGHDGVYHHFSPQHLHRYVTEFTGRHNQRPMDTVEQMSAMATSLEGKQLPYADLIGPKS